MKTLLIALSVLTIFLIASCGTSWDWKADTYAADSNTQSIFNAEGKEVFCNQVEFNDFLCFPSANIAELKYNIEKLKISKKKKMLLLNMVDSLQRK